MKPATDNPAADNPAADNRTREDANPKRDSRGDVGRAPGSTGLLQPGRNCFRLERARRLALLVDGEAYFAAVRQTMIRARRRIMLVGWDLHSEVELVRDGDDDGLPTRLGDLLIALLERREELHAHVLLWNWAPIYALEREPLYFGSGPWKGHPRLHFIKDDQHPTAASHHQKLVGIDGRLAWCGGLDLSQWRWDTNAHPAEEPRRRQPDGSPYPPFHDQQMLVDADAAAALEEVMRERWRSAGGDPLPSLAADDDADADADRGSGVARGADSDPWPEDIEPWLRDQMVAVARTLPEYKDRTEVRESEQLYIDMIDAAQDLIYIENQYLTSRKVRDALCRALQRERPPSVVAILPKDTGKWLEQYTMDALRVRTLNELRDADPQQRLAVYYPDVPGLEEGCMMVHSKLMIIDDRLLRIGSSNLSNRSLGLDSECDVAIEAHDDATSEAIAGLRRRLIAMYMWMSPEEVADAEARAAGEGGGLNEAIEFLREKKEREAPASENRLQPITGGELEPQWEDQMPDERVVDPDRPLSPELLTQVVAEPEHHPHVRRRIAVGLAIIAVFSGLATLWHFTPLGDWVHPQGVIHAVRSLAGSFWGPVVAVGGFLIATVTIVPVSLVILMSALVFGPVGGALIALVGTAIAAMSGYEIGRWLGRKEIEHLVGGRLDRVKRRLSRRGALAIATVRLVPVAPFAILNLIAGASAWRRRDFITGSLIGMLPAILLMAYVGRWLLGYMERDDLRAIALVIGIALILFGSADLLRRIILRGFRRHPRTAETPT